MNFQVILTVRKSQVTIQRKRWRTVAITKTSTVPSREPLEMRIVMMVMMIMMITMVSACNLAASSSLGGIAPL